MPSPTSGTTVIRPGLADSLWEWTPEDQRLIGLDLFPIFETQERSGDYGVIPTETFLKLPASIKRNANGTYVRGAWQFETDTFGCIERGYEEPVDATEARAYERYFDAEELAGQRAKHIVLTMQEKRILDACQSASNWGSGSATSVTNEWDDATNAEPAEDVKAAVLSALSTYGVLLDTLVIGFETFQNLGDVDSIIERIMHVSTAVIDANLTTAMLARALGIRQVLVSNAFYDTTDEGQSTTGSFLWNPEYALLCKVARGASLRQPCIGRTFLWTADSPDNATVESYYEDQIRGDVIRVRQHTDEEIIMGAAGVLFDNIVT